MAPYGMKGNAWQGMSAWMDMQKSEPAHFWEEQERKEHERIIDRDTYVVLLTNADLAFTRPEDLLCCHGDSSLSLPLA